MSRKRNCSLEVNCVTKPISLSYFLMYQLTYLFVGDTNRQDTSVDPLCGTPRPGVGVVLER